MAQRGFAVAGLRDGGQWRIEPLPPAVLGDLGVLLQALRSQPPSNMTASVEYPLAEQALTRLGEEPPDDDELDELWPVGDLDLFDDLGLSEEEMEQILDDIDAYPDEMLEAIVDRIGIADEYQQATESARAAL